MFDYNIHCYISLEQKDATEGYEMEIGDQIRQDPTLWAKDPLSGVDNVVHRNLVFASVMHIFSLH